MKIHILPVEIRQKIAAGEVVERPASVLKELIENALDAGAETIQVEIQEAGRRLVRVTDDGCGMSPQDVPLAFERFATSKVLQEEDIHAVRTFGFRGEALPSIAAVSRLRLVTRERGALYGTEARVEGGRLTSLQQVGAPVGTMVEVGDLFFNTPARRKFLRSFKTEYGHLLGTFTRFALAFPEKRFTLKSEGREMALQPGPFQARMEALFGQEPVARMEEFSAEGSSGRVWGAFVPVQGPKRLYVFVNRRAVKCSTVFRALRDALKEPGIVLVFVEVPPSFVDVNIHPAKAEVRFQEEEAIYELVREGLLRRVSWGRVGGVAEPAGAYPEAGQRFMLLGQLEETFLLAFSQGHLYLIDQHAASERVLYDRLMTGRGEKGGRMLLAPQVVLLSEEEQKVLVGSQGELERCGFVLEPFGPGAFAVRSVPAFLDPRAVEGVFRHLIAHLRGIEPSKRDDEVARTLSCLAALKAGKTLSKEEQERLLLEWSHSTNPHACVHNRPIYFRLSLEEVKRKVGRTGGSCGPF